MKAEYSVKINGKWYRAGDELPAPSANKVEEPTKVEPEKVKEPEGLLDDDLTMAELRKLAKEKGIKVPIGTSKAELKEKLGI